MWKTGLVWSSSINWPQGLMRGKVVCVPGCCIYDSWECSAGETGWKRWCPGWKGSGVISRTLLSWRSWRAVRVHTRIFFFLFSVLIIYWRLARSCDVEVITIWLLMRWWWIQCKTRSFELVEAWIFYFFSNCLRKNILSCALFAPHVPAYRHAQELDWLHSRECRASNVLFTDASLVVQTWREQGRAHSLEVLYWGSPVCFPSHTCCLVSVRKSVIHQQMGSGTVN